MGWDNPPVPWRELRQRMSWPAEGQPPPPEPVRLEPVPPAPERTEPAGPPWAELHCHSSYSFLDGASSPGELVADHTHSLMSSHLIDVVSTDQHTVKPWFAGRTDVSPEVADFAAQGYRLLGGRVEVLDHQRAAVLVYQHGAHFINVYTWAVGSGGVPQNTMRRGYRLAFWKEGDLGYCAVSDAGWSELAVLASLIKDLGTRDLPR